MKKILIVWILVFLCGVGSVMAVDCSPDLNETPCNVNGYLELIPDTYYDINAVIYVINDSHLNLNDSTLILYNSIYFNNNISNITIENGILFNFTQAALNIDRNGYIYDVNIDNIIFNCTGVSSDYYIRQIASYLDIQNLTIKNSIFEGKPTTYVMAFYSEGDGFYFINNSLLTNAQSATRIELYMYNKTIENNTFRTNITFRNMVDDKIYHNSFLMNTSSDYDISSGYATANFWNLSSILNCTDVNGDNKCDSWQTIDSVLYETDAYLIEKGWETDGLCDSILGSTPCNISENVTLIPFLDTYDFSSTANAIGFLDNTVLVLNGSIILSTSSPFRFWTGTNKTVKNGYINLTGGTNMFRSSSNNINLSNLTINIFNSIRMFYTDTGIYYNFSLTNSYINASNLSGAVIFGTALEEYVDILDNTIYSNGQIHIYSYDDSSIVNISNNILDIDFINIISNGTIEVKNNNITMFNETAITIAKWVGSLTYDFKIMLNDFISYVTKAINFVNIEPFYINVTQNNFMVNVTHYITSNNAYYGNVTENYYNKTDCVDVDNDGYCDSSLLVGNDTEEVWDIHAWVSENGSFVDVTRPDLLSNTSSATTVEQNANIAFTIIVRDNNSAVSAPTIDIRNNDNIITTYSMGLISGTNTNDTNMTWRYTLTPTTIGNWTWLWINLSDVSGNTYNESPEINFTVTTPADDGDGGGGGGGADDAVTDEMLQSVLDIIEDLNYTYIPETDEHFAVKTDVNAKKYVLIGMKAKNMTKLLLIYNIFDHSRNVTLACVESEKGVCDRVTFSNSSFELYPSSLPRVEDFTFYANESLSFKIVGITDNGEQSSIQIDYRLISLTFILLMVVPVVVLLGSILVGVLLYRKK